MHRPGVAGLGDGLGVQEAVLAKFLALVFPGLPGVKRGVAFGAGLIRHDVYLSEVLKSSEFRVPSWTLPFHVEKWPKNLLKT
jgi:hypothetical protein